MTLFVSTLTRPSTFLVAILSFLLLAGCGRKNSPAAAGSSVADNDAKQTRLEWNLKTLVDAYQKAGHTNSRWDAPAGQALSEFARLRSSGGEAIDTAPEVIGKNCELALKAGCDDPLIAYLHTRFVLNNTSSPQLVAEKLSQVAMDMQNSSYPAIRKFYASRMAVEKLYSAFGTNVNQETLTAVGGNLLRLLDEAISDKTMPPREVYEACEGALAAYKGNAKRFERCYRDLEGPVFKTWPDAAESWMLKASAYTSMAWHARGSGYANTVSDSGWKLFKERLEVAEEALDRAWKLNPKDCRICVQMLTVELGQGKGRRRMELWFDRAMEVDPNCYDACTKKLYYLEPKWHGSDDDMLDFGRQCVESKVWGGKVPLILLDAHEAIAAYVEKPKRPDYWKRPGVWKDIEISFDRFFQLNPNATGWYHNYLLYASRCEQWNKVNELIPKLGQINYSYFGGKAEFDRIVGLANRHKSPGQADSPR